VNTTVVNFNATDPAASSGLFLFKDGSPLFEIGEQQAGGAVTGNIPQEPDTAGRDEPSFPEEVGGSSATLGSPGGNGFSPL